jgi:cytochrome c-type biogenesis protein CcmH/NrfF
VRVPLPRRHVLARLIFALALVLFASAGASAAASKASQQEVAEALTCQCGCGLTVANCNHPNCEFSVPVREKIDTMLAHGMGRTEIIAYFRSQYGEKILSAPTTQGFNILAWTMPFMALAAGCALIIFTVGRWHKGPPAPTSSRTPAADQAAVDPELRRRLEREMKERI